MCTFPTLALPSLDLVCIRHRKPRFRTLLKNAVVHFCKNIIFTTFKTLTNYPAILKTLYWTTNNLKAPIFKKSIGFCQCKILRSFTRLSCFISAGTGFGSHLVKCRILSFTRRLVAAKKEKTKKTHILSNSGSKPQTISERTNVEKPNKHRVTIFW